MILRRSYSAVFLLFLMLAGITVLHGNDWVFSGMPGRHRGAVNAIVHLGDTVVSAGEDGFLEIWNPRSAAAVDRFQVSPYRITAMAGRPGRDEVCIVESDESDRLGQCRISAWNYRERRNIFTLPLSGTINHVNYSMGGTFIIAAGNGRTGLILIDAATGDILQSPQSLSGGVALAITGRSERNMVTYLSSGALSYWDLETGNETNRFRAPANLFSPVIFSNSRYLAGVNAEGLAVVHAASGEILGRDSSIPDGSLLCSLDDTLICLVQRNNSAAELYQYSVDRNGRLSNNGRVFLSVSVNDRFTAIDTFGSGNSDAAPNAIALGTAGGSIVLTGVNGRSQILSAADRTYIADAAVSGGTIAFIAENGTIGFIPLNYSQLTAGRSIRLVKNDEESSRLIAYASEDGSSGRFIFWQDSNTRIRPVIRSSGTGSETVELLDYLRNNRGEVVLRSPIHLVSSFEGKIQFLDTMGNLAVISPYDTDKSRSITFFSTQDLGVGLMSAAFVDRDRLIIGRSAVSGNTPLMMINVHTGETVPLPYPSQAGMTVHRGSSGSVYAAVILSSANETSSTFTSILRINLANSANSVRLADFRGEYTRFSLTETPGGIAATMGGENAAIYSDSGVQKLDRTGGLPLKLVDGGQFLINLDGDGSIAWHDSRSGKLLAVFRLHQNRWTLQTERATISGQ